MYHWGDMSEEFIAPTFTDEFSDFQQPVNQNSGVADATLQSARQTVTLIQPMHAIHPSSDAQNAVPQQLHPATFPTQMLLSGNQPTQYVVQTPVSFVQTSVSGQVPMMAPSMQAIPAHHAQLLPAQGGPPRTVIITQRPVTAGTAPTIINTVTPKVVTLPGIARPILEKKVTVVTSTGNIVNTPTITSQPIIIHTSSPQSIVQTTQVQRTVITSPTKAPVKGRAVGVRGGGAVAAGRGRGRGRGNDSSPNDGKKRKDPNAPAACLSAYKFFFKETGQTVKSHNPAAKFGDVSRIVASMWERLSDDEKAVYRKRSEDDKARYNREMQAYRASKQVEAAAGAKDGENEDEYDSNNINASNNSVVFSSTSTTPAVVISTLKPRVDPEDVTDTACIRKGCENLAIRNSEWEDEYCSNECVVSHCKDVFADWVGGHFAEQTAN